MRESFTGELFTQYHNEDMKRFASDNGITAIPGTSRPGLGLGIIHHNGNSGAQAINLAYLRGARRILLLGFDMNNTGGKAHWFGDHPKELRNSGYSAYINHFCRLATDLKRKGVDVINCSPYTALHQFRRAPLDAVL